MDEPGKRMLKEWIAEMQASPGLPLWPAGKTPGWRAEYGQPEPSIVPFLAEPGSQERGAVIICPGGGYEIKAPHEGRPIARWLNGAGIHAFVLDYRIAPYTIDMPLLDVKRAIRTVRHRAAEWNVNPEKIAVLGFSAGGHLTIMASTHFDIGDPNATDPVERESSRPDAQVPCYPLVTYKPLMRRKAIQDWLDSVSGPENKVERAAWTFGDEAVRNDTPPAFLWGTWDDFLYQQWPLYLKALKRNQVAFSYHLFPTGGHGMGLAEKNTQASQWPALCAAWLKELGF